MNQSGARNKAMDLLSRREHSFKELYDKLRLRGFEPDEIDVALEKLVSENLLNDDRFTESYVHYRVQKGFGPLRIKNELSDKGIDNEIIQNQMESYESAWSELMQQQRIKKFGAEIPADYKEKMKQARFLQNRGFSPESVMRLFR
ncbi:MAG: regulatory protein RecX [Gammaproteobacteria bacterium]|nr:regulatory protein RecX [Gammaproteobacteria bacterium]